MFPILKICRGCLSLTLFSVALLTGCTTSHPPVLYPEAIEINASLRLGMQQYDKFGLQKAFAGANDGAHSYYYLGDEANRVVRSALSGCQRYASRPCRVLDINGQSFQDEYLRFSAESQKALANMRVPPTMAYHFESLDWKVPSPVRLRTHAEGYHAPTPLTLNGIKTITTVELAKMLKEGRITLIDARGWGDTPLLTLPNAYLIDWGGMEDGERGGREATLRQNLARIMQLIQSDKTQPVGVFCASAECWVSVNAALRLQALGYTNISWYRGGMEALMAAKLPTVVAVPHATVWSE
ncbi:hypothetical protein EGT07_00340 [Herbaspirillum sp. HC18]|nr:hypothetical protein EGT07_00340 [Herbaspirillum sp. HC18]